MYVCRKLCVPRNTLLTIPLTKPWIKEFWCSGCAEWEMRSFTNKKGGSFSGSFCDAASCTGTGLSVVWSRFWKPCQPALTSSSLHSQLCVLEKTPSPPFPRGQYGPASWGLLGESRRQWVWRVWRGLWNIQMPNVSCYRYLGELKWHCFLELLVGSETKIFLPLSFWIWLIGMDV